MRSATRIPALATLLVAVSLASGAAAQERRLEVRRVPAPAGASEELRASIAATPSREIGPLRREVPATPEEWAALVKKRDADALALTKLHLERSGVGIRRGEIAGVGVHRLQPKRVDPVHAGQLFVFLHSGAYLFGGGRGGLYEAILIAERVGIPVLSIDYRLAPADPFPAAIEDVAKVWAALVRTRPADSMAMGGSSAGGGLALAVTHHLKSRGQPLPGALFAGTPWTDLTKTGDSLYTNEGLDRVLWTYDGFLTAAAALYASGADLDDPRISPVRGDFRGFPPVQLVTGTRDLLLSDTVRVHRKLREAGVSAELNVYEGLSHGEYLLVWNTPESRRVFDEMSDFLAARLGPGPDSPGSPLPGSTSAGPTSPGASSTRP